MTRLDRLARELGGEVPRGADSIEVGDVHLDSRCVTPASLFVALPGAERDGRAFLESAARAGAVAALVPIDAVGEDAPLPCWRHPQPRRAAGLAAAVVHGHPSRSLDVCAVTGTNGKTTVAHLLGHLLRRAGRTPAVLGTTGHRLAGGVEIEARHTTPDAPELQRLLAEHRRRGGDSAAMEASSHALDQDRIAGIELRAAVFTNLSREHLDYHGDMDRYARAKARLFEQLGSGSTAVLNRDCPAWALMAEAAGSRGARVVTFGMDSRADLHASRRSSDSQGSQLVIDGMGIKSTASRLPLRGRYNVENALAAAAAARVLGASPSDVLGGLATASAAPGRLEPVPTGARGFDVFVDYAHSPDALERVLGLLREELHARGALSRLIVVFGCGGERDVGKRPQMGRIAARLADLVYLTSDNPRREAPERIIADILAGVGEGPGRVEVEPDRAAAIRAALEAARPGDVVLLAGKGHERTQAHGGLERAFDDRAVAREVLA